MTKEDYMKLSKERLADKASEVTKEKCYGCKWLFESGATKKVSCLNSKICINYSELERKVTIDQVCQLLKYKYDDIGLQWMRGVNVSDVIDDFRSELEKI